MVLPILLSVPHAGLEVPDEVRRASLLTAQEIAADGDGGAAAIYLPLGDDVAALVTTQVARAFVDMNRAADDIRKDGVVKTHTCWDVPIYRSPLADDVVELLIEQHWRPYHEQLVRVAPDMLLGIDGHTMASHGPPVGPDAGVERPAVCLGNVGGESAPSRWMQVLADALAEELGVEVAQNVPFSGGYITRSRPGGIPWIQVEFSRAAFRTDEEKSLALRRALGRLVEVI